MRHLSPPLVTICIAYPNLLQPHLSWQLMLHWLRLYYNLLCKQLPSLPLPCSLPIPCSRIRSVLSAIYRVEAHPIPEHPRPRRCKGRIALVGDAAGYVTKCSGEGIYFAAKSGRMCAEEIVKASQEGKKMAGEAAIRAYLDK